MVGQTVGTENAEIRDDRCYSASRFIYFSNGVSFSPKGTNFNGGKNQ